MDIKVSGVRLPSLDVRGLGRDDVSLQEKNVLPPSREWLFSLDIGIWSTVQTFQDSIFFDKKLSVGHFCMLKSLFTEFWVTAAEILQRPFLILRNCKVAPKGGLLPPLEWLPILLTGGHKEWFYKNKTQAFFQHWNVSWHSFCAC